jgi:glycerophosphoryl diester phosphodiesterase
MPYILAFSAIGLFIGLYMFLVASDNTRKMHDFKKWHYAHRGLHDLKDGCAENTMPAFERAVNAGYGIELDIQLSKDGQAIVFHDDTLLRACGVDVNVVDFTYEELKKYNLFGTGQHIPLLDDVLRLVSGRVPLIIEIKSNANWRAACVAVSNLLNGYKGLFCIESFDPRIVKWFRKYRPDVTRGQLSCMFREPNDLSLPTAFLISYLLVNFMSRPHFIAYKYSDRHNLSFKLARRILKANTVAWTIKSSEEMVSGIKLFDMFIFEGFMP